VKTLALLILAIACNKPSARAPEPVAKPATAQAAAAQPDATRGKVLRRHFHSDALGVDKTYVVYLPADYDAKPAVHWPVFYYLHGLTGSENDWIKGGHVDATADKLGLRAIVVMPDGDDNWYVDSAAPDPDYDACLRDGTGLYAFGHRKPADTCVRHAAYETYIVKDLLGEIDSHFRTIPSRDGRAIAGLSMGGFGALELAMRHQDLFAAAASHSGVDSLMYAGPHPYVAGKAQLVTDPNAWGKGVEAIGMWVRPIFGSNLANWQAHDPAALVAKLEPGKLAIYLDCGTEDVFHLQDGTTYFHDLLTAKHIEHAFYIGPGGHDFGFWGPRLPESLKFLAAHVSSPK
jgi:S-formylglutathione hydrolase FrmB